MFADHDDHGDHGDEEVHSTERVTHLLVPQAMHFAEHHHAKGVNFTSKYYFLFFKNLIFHR